MSQTSNTCAQCGRVLLLWSNAKCPDCTQLPRIRARQEEHDRLVAENVARIEAAAKALPDPLSS